MVLLSNVGLECFWQTGGNEKWGELGNGFVIVYTNTKIVP